MVGYVLACIAVGFLVACPLTALLVSLGHRMGTLDSPGVAGHVKRLRRVPNIGGIAIFWGVAAPLGGALLAVGLLPERFFDAVPAASRFEGRLLASWPTFAAILLGAAVLHVLGLVDDRRALGPWIKLLVQLGVAALVVLFFDVRLLSVLDRWFVGGEWLSVAVTIAWIILVTNALNFIDNMDGLAAGLGGIAALVLMIATTMNEQWFVAATLGLLVGSLGGFLVFNRPPARIFMGDGGSLVVGFLLATMAARTTFTDTEDPTFALGSAWYGVFMPLVALSIPLYDIVTVSAIRLAGGRSPLRASDEHFSHRLVRLGLSRAQAVGILCLLGATTGISGIVLGTLRPWQAVLVGFQAVFVLVVIAILERAVHAARSGRDG